MPYIKPDRREAIMEATEFTTPPDHVETAGELNWLITMAVRQYVRQQKLSYQTINDVIGALEGAKLEFYRRVAAPYENEKWAENGDVY